MNKTDYIKEATKGVKKDWLEILLAPEAIEQLHKIFDFLIKESENNICYPPTEKIFNAFKHANLVDTKVIILGQDPYHGENQANGLSFSVNEGIKLPPSLRNIFKELNNSAGCENSNSGDLTKWAKQGVLLLNSVLTVSKNQPLSHQKAGWETLTDYIIKKVSESKEHLVFMLWGNHAIKKKSLIETKKHLILEAMHPSPFSAYRGFFGCNHFTLSNSYLIKHHKKPIEWCLK